MWLINQQAEQRVSNNFFLGTAFNPSQEFKNELTTGTISALSTSFQKAVSLGIYDKKMIVRVYEPSKIREAFFVALQWQIHLETSSDAEYVEVRKKEKKLARRIFVSHFIPY